MMSVVYRMEAGDCGLGRQLFKRTLSRTTWSALAWVFVEDAVLKFWPNTGKGQLGPIPSAQTVDAGFPNRESQQAHLGAGGLQCKPPFPCSQLALLTPVFIGWMLASGLTYFTGFHGGA